MVSTVPDDVVSSTVLVEERFASKFVHDAATDCMPWIAAKSSGGYGSFFLSGQMICAHRWAYEAMNGPIAPGLTIDHLCRNRGCVNPEHLEAVTHEVNVQRGKNFRHNGLCPAHRVLVQSEEFWWTHKDSRRGCRVCADVARRDSKHQLAQQKAGARVMRRFAPVLG